MNVFVLLGKKLGIYLLAVGTTYVLASAAATQHVAGRLGTMGIEIGFGQRAAILVTALLCRWLSRWRVPLYVLAGATALVCIHVALNQAFGLTPVATARSGVGLLFQGLAGAVGGLVYIQLNLRTFQNNTFDITE